MSGKIRDAEIGEYKGYPIITIPVGEAGNISFGVKKARAILEYMDEIENFVIVEEERRRR